MKINKDIIIQINIPMNLWIFIDFILLFQHKSIYELSDFYTPELWYGVRPSVWLSDK